MKSELSEYQLALKARDGDREALSLLIRRTRPRLFALAYAELQHYEDAQDVVATALLRICRHIHRLQEPERIDSWMNSIVRNEARRKRSIRTEHLWESLSNQTAHVDDTAVFLLRIDIERGLARLPPQQAVALRLFHLTSLPISKIAEFFGCSEGTIKSWLHRGRRQLAVILEEYRPMEPRTDAQRDPQAANQAVRSFAALAKWASNKTLAMSVQQGKQEIEPDDLALILLTDEDQASYRSLRSLGVDMDAMRQELLHRLGSPTLTPLPLQDFLEAAQKAHKTARFNRVEELTYMEAGQSHARRLSTAHLLLGILGAGESVTSQLLAEQGISMEALRSAALPFNAEEENDSDAYYNHEAEKFAPLWEQAWTRASDYVQAGTA